MEKYFVTPLGCKGNGNANNSPKVYERNRKSRNRKSRNMEIKKIKLFGHNPGKTKVVSQCGTGSSGCPYFLLCPTPARQNEWHIFSLLMTTRLKIYYLNYSALEILRNDG